MQGKSLWHKHKGFVKPYWVLNKGSGTNISFWSHLGKLNKYGLDSAQFATFPPTLPWKHQNACFKEKWDQASQVRHGHCHRGGPKPPILTPDTDKTRGFKEWPTGCLVSCQCELPAEHPDYKGVALWGKSPKVSHPHASRSSGGVL